MSLRATVASRLVRPALSPRCHAVIRHLSRHYASLDGPATSPPAPPSVRMSAEPQRTAGPSSKPEGPRELSDQEWEIRTGRAIYVLQQTLPTFFSTGLISSVDTSGSNSRTKEEDEISIYSPNIRLEYRPPTQFPPPFPRTLHVEGLPLYLASSAFVRHTLNALYTDLRVELRRVRVHGPRSSSGLRPDTPEATPETHQQQGKTRSIREKSLFIGLVVRGTNRVSKAEGGWEVNSTYTFSPTTGLIHLHNIDSIHPAPHEAFFSALQAALNKIGLGGPQGETGAGGVARSSAPSPPQRSPSVADRS
ncbi:hypothetical protein K466DRAFT_493073 [Polyporus arcularius HHB13444]|uniref:Uncharacterized protein n=1 Tax=Polyporus arcularius HHB13444 TaxID=1314778 RepID=A0A5C3PDJ1_9APHY|nr:hypothetical protein K466DRAFT_493073 [Polyporus arcularius HHB13444]